jgi:hypothetical protein
MPLAEGLFTVDGLPAHPLLVDAVAVLLPLAALCAVGLALHRGVRRRFGWAVLALTGVAVAAVPLAQATGRQLRDRLGPPSAVLTRHEQLGSQLLPYALGFGVTVLLLVVAGKLADRERTASTRAEHVRAGANTTLTGANAPVESGDQAEPGGTRSVSTTWQRISVLASVLVIGMAALTTVDVVRIGTTGAQSVWQGVAR